jgi:hypothetical protein
MLRRAAVPFVLALAPVAAQDGDPILRQLPADATNLIVVRDPMPHVDAILESAELRAVTEAVGPLLREELGFDVAPAALKRQLALFTDLVPTEIVVAASPATALSLANMVRAGQTALSLEFDQDAGKIRASMPTGESVHLEALAKALAAVTAPSLVAWVRVRNERVAERWFDQCADLLAKGKEREPELRVEVDGPSLRVRVQPAKVRGGLLAQHLRGLGLGDEALAPLLALEFQATLEQDGACLRLRLGEPAPPPLAAGKLGRLWRPGNAQWMFGQIDFEAAQEVLATVVESDEVAAPAAMSAPLIAFRAFLQGAVDAGPRVHAAIDIDRGIVRTTEHDFGDAIDDVDYEPAPQELVRCLRPEDGPFLLTSLPLDALLVGVHQEVLDQLASRANRRGGLLAFAAIRDRGAALFDYLGSEDSAVFETGAAIVTRAAACRRLRAGEYTLPALPFCAVAVIAVAEDADTASGFVDRTTQLLAEALGAEGKALWAPADLGLGVPTRSLQWQKFTPAGFELDADFAPHAAQSHDVLILSTDLALTRELLARIEGRDQAVTPGPRTIGWTRASGEHIASAIGGARSWVEALNTAGALHADAALPVLTALESLARQFDRYEGLLEFDGTWLREVDTWKLRDGTK